MNNRAHSDAWPAENAAGGCRAGALDFGIRGVRAGVVVRSQPLVLDLVGEGSSPASLLTLTDNNDVPNFPNLLDRLGEDCLVDVDNRAPQKPHLHLRDLFRELTASLKGWLDPSGSVRVVVSAYATDLQRALILRAANSAEWPTVNLINKTTALAIHGLQQRHSGTYVALVLGHGPAEASVMEWQDRRLRTLSYCSEARLAGDELDRSFLKRALRSLTFPASSSRPSKAFRSAEWMWLRNRAESARLGLNRHESVTVELPSSLTGCPAQDVVFDRHSYAEDLEPILTLLNDLIRRCCREAGIAMDDLKGFLVTGGLSMHVPIFQRLSGLCQDRLDIFGVDAQLLGGCEFASQEPFINEEMPSAPQRPFPVRKQDSLYIAADAIPSQSLRQPYSGHAARSAELKLRPAPGSFAHAADNVQEARPQVVSPAVSPSEGSRGTSADEGRGPLQNAGNQRLEREYVRARKYLRMAEASLKSGRLEESVRLSHQARQTSNDSRIFRVMIEIHLRAASRHPPAPGTFVDDRRWLLCALNDDGTNYEVQKAVMNRFMTHTKQLLALGTAGARSEAAASLDELLRYVPAADEAQQLLGQIRAESMR